MSSETLNYLDTISDEWSLFLDRSSAPVVRPISRWVEEELILPSGQFSGERYRHRRHPASRLWFAEIDSGRWNRCAATAPTQNGKTLMCYVAPLLYHLFELQETCIIGLPTMQMANDKWSEDLLPAIEASRYRDLLPLSGEGSRGGQVKRAIRFRNDVTLRFMSAGGGDKQRAGYTARVLAVTETDGMDEPGETSREADKIEQLEGRTRAYGSAKRIYLECTVSIETGRIWQEITHGSDSRIYRPCVYCGQYVSPEREHFVGWQEADSELEAGDKSHWICPECSHEWTEEDRWSAASAAVLVHRGQKAMPSGDVVGDLPPTRTLGFRWSAIDNPFTTAADLGAEEWRSQRSPHRDSVEKKMRQFIWCLPWIPPEVVLTPLEPEQVAQRSGGLRKGVVPADTVGVAVGVDTGKQQLHWHATAIRPDGSMHVIEYGIQPTEAKQVGTVRGLIDALTALHAYFTEGWADESGRRWKPSQVWVDSGYHEHRAAVYQFCQLASRGTDIGQAIYRPIKGFGERQRGTTRYMAPRQKGGDVRYIGREYDFRLQKNDRVLLVQINSDYWKSELHQRMAMATDQPGAITLYEALSPREHVDYSEQITAEVQKEQWMDGRGEVVVWDRIRRNNHFLDAGYVSIAACDFISRETERVGRDPGEQTLAQMAAASGTAHG